LSRKLGKFARFEDFQDFSCNEGFNDGTSGSNLEVTMKKQYITAQANMLTAGQIDRRKFIMSALAAGVVLPAALSMADKAMAATPNKGGLLRMGRGHGSTTDSLDPATYENGFSQGLCYAYANHLTEVGADGQLRPELAESYESADAKTWVFNLRQGVEFHNGKTMT
jgi:peptide/nickel transport system substrate-binding protein